MRTSLALRALPMLLCCSVPVMAQRTARDPNQASDEWLEKIGIVAALSKPFAAAELLDLLREFAHCSG